MVVDSEECAAAEAATVSAGVIPSMVVPILSAAVSFRVLRGVGQLRASCENRRWKGKGDREASDGLSSATGTVLKRSCLFGDCKAECLAGDRRKPPKALILRVACCFQRLVQLSDYRYGGCRG